MLSRMEHALGGGAVGTVIEWHSIRMRRRFADDCRRSGSRERRDAAAERDHPIRQLIASADRHE
jgi:hypothetical protein